jgi:hypothetical protein
MSVDATAGRLRLTEEVVERYVETRMEEFGIDTLRINSVLFFLRPPVKKREERNIA